MGKVDDYLEKEKQDRNAWWRLSSGEHQNLFDLAVQERDELKAEVERLKAELSQINDLLKNAPPVSESSDVKELTEKLQNAHELGDAMAHVIAQLVFEPETVKAWREFWEGQSDD